MIHTRAWHLSIAGLPDDIHDPADDAPVINPWNTMRPGKVALDTGNPGMRKIKKFLRQTLRQLEEENSRLKK
ncbi:MAG: hypothetical protein J1E80_06420 [Desulfovibrionaceae bacterium]|nr:hypothetical protein [Desulfovibrionaceae bacterium]